MSTLVYPTADTTAREPVPNGHGNTLAKGYLDNSGDGTNGRSYYVHFSRPFRNGAFVTEAKLTLHLGEIWAGTNHITIRRVTQKWAENTLTWNNKPTATDTNLVTATVTDGAKGDAVTFDLSAMFNDVSSGAAYYGLHVTTDATVLLSVYGLKWGKATMRPTMEFGWTLAPQAPDELVPNGQQAVSSAYPTLNWRFVDNVVSATQASSQVQLMKGDGSGDPPDFDTGPVDYDTGKQTNLDSSWDTNDGVFTGVTALDDWWWRVKVWDDSDRASDWSDPAEFQLTALGTLTLNSPTATTDTLAPEVVWTLTGATQKRWRITLVPDTHIASTEKTLYTASATNADTAATIPAGYITSGQDYILILDVWDDVDRVNGDYLTVQQVFSYVRDGTPAGPDTLTVLPYVDTLGRVTPALDIEVTRANAPDYWSLRVGGKEVLPRISVADTHVSGDTYRIIYWGANPRRPHVIEVEAVTLTTGPKYIHSGNNPTETVTFNTPGIWLAYVTDPGTDPGTTVMIAGNDPSLNTIAIGESGTTFDLVGAHSPIRITDSVRGYEGTIGGLLPYKDDRDNLLTLKALEDDIQLVYGDICVPVRLEEVAPQPNPYPDQGDDATYAVSINLFQSGPPWPVDA